MEEAGLGDRHHMIFSGTAATYGPGRAVVTATGMQTQMGLIVADQANNAVLQERDGRWTVQGDPTEGALIVAARKAGLKDEALDARFERIGEVPFSSERKLMTTIHADAERRERLLVFTKGAPDVLLARCSHELVTDGEPALALGVGPPDEGVMRQPPRPRGERVITRRMWVGIFFVGAIMAVIYVPFLQQAFSTVSLSLGDWLRCVAVASSVLWLRELSKVLTRATIGR
jgi:magnesium-transporting ATPase (P-type)